jgi:FtsP/CotA-like multicopper oxidase with cupredoxin domain
MRKTLVIAIAGVLIAASTMFMPRVSGAATFYLRTGQTTLTMPDGTDVTMWGFAQDSAAGAGDGTVTIPGPRLTIPPGDATLTIQLENTLDDPVSLIIPGLPTTMSPVKRNGRIYSLTHEAAPGGSATYTWNNVRPGSFIYHSASHMQVQVQMGLSGAVTKDHAAGQAYPGAMYDQEEIVFYSEIDPVIHKAVADGSYGPGLSMTSTIDYEPIYFLVNGDADQSFMGAQAAAGTTVLFRFFNGALTTKAPFIRGGHMTMLAEDGFEKPYPIQRFGVDLPAMKTKDGLFTVPAGANMQAASDGEANIKIADRRAYISKGVLPGDGGTTPTEDPGGGDPGGGDPGGGTGGGATTADASTGAGGGGGGCFIGAIQP